MLSINACVLIIRVLLSNSLLYLHSLVIYYRGDLISYNHRSSESIILIILQTRELIEDLRSASGLEMHGGKSKLGADSKTLLRILCHRSDSEASQFLKKQYKMPKSSA